MFCYAVPAVMDDVWLNRAGILAEAVSFLLIAPEIIGVERLRRVEAALAALGRRTLSTPTRTWTGERAAADGPLRLLPDRPAPKDRSTLWDLGDDLGLVAFLAIVEMPLILLAGRSTTWAITGYLIASYLGGFAATLIPRGSRVGAWARWPLVLFGLPTHWGRALTSDSGFRLVRVVVSLGVSLLSGRDRLRALVFGTGVVFLFGGMGAQLVATF